MAYVSPGPPDGKLVMTVSVVGQNMALMGYGNRASLPNACHSLTSSPSSHTTPSISQKHVGQAWEEADITTKWTTPRRTAKIDTRGREVKMTDFDGFKVMEKKKLMSRIIKNEAKILQKKKKEAMLEASPGHLPRPETEKCQLPYGNSNSWL